MDEMIDSKMDQEFGKPEKSSRVEVLPVGLWVLSLAERYAKRAGKTACSG